MPHNMQDNPEYANLIKEIIEYLKEAVERAEAGGIDKSRMIVDPGIGFGKTAAHNLEILRCLDQFKILGLPVLIGFQAEQEVRCLFRLCPGPVGPDKPDPPGIGSPEACNSLIPDLLIH